MLRSVGSKVAWVGRTASVVFGLALVLALVVGVASAAFGANGQAWILGQSNVATAITRLAGAAGVNGPMLAITNNNADANDTALALNVQAGEAPMRVNSAKKVANLNADKLDGKEASGFYAAGSKVEDSAHADQADSATNAQNAHNADLFDGLDSSEFPPAYKRTVVVSPVGTDTENGTALLEAIAGITGASATKPYLLWVEPGIYDLGNGSLEMKEHVDIQGSGELNTLITSGYSNCFGGTVVGANDAELRLLTVTNTGAGQCNVALYNDSASPRLTHTTIEAVGAGGLGTENNGVYNTTNANTTMTNVTVTASGGGVNYGVYSEFSSTTMTNVTATASGGEDNFGVQNTQANATIRDSTLSGDTNALFQDDGTGKVANTQLVGPVSTGAEGNLQCSNNYDENMAAVTCQ